MPQSVVPYGRDLAAGEVLPFHRHRRAQLVYARAGVMLVTTRDGAYLVPPQRAVWMPGGIEHRIEARSALAMRNLYIDEAKAPGLRARVEVLEISPLLSELVAELVRDGPAYEPDSAMSRLAGVVIDQIRVQPTTNLALVMPTDPRARRIAETLIADPADNRKLDAWVETVGSSTRTISRLFKSQTGLSFQAWRQQCRLMRGMELLAAGSSVTTVALDVGYDGASAFIAMFHRTVGVTPAQYAQSLSR